MTNEEIQIYIEKYMCHPDGTPMVDVQAFYEGAKWMRDKALSLAPVVGRSEQLCQHDRSVTNRICDDCGSVITYVPDDELA